MLEDCLGQEYRRRRRTLCVEGCQNVLEDCFGQEYRRRRRTLCVKECPKCVRRLP